LFAAGRAAKDTPFCGKSIEMPFLEAFTSKIGLFAIQVNQVIFYIPPNSKSRLANLPVGSYVEKQFIYRDRY
jgi:hypothetical protein